jgi:hypothetical protein
MDKNFSDYIVYVDESGDHGLKTIDPHYPVFVLVFCIFKKDDYINTAIPLLQRFKFKHYGHDQTILHETDIRKDRGEFTFLKSKIVKTAFLDELTGIVQKTPFVLISTVIKKELYRQRYSTPENPYHIALRYGLERVFYYLSELQANLGKTHIVVEKRGKVEDDELELEFRRVCDGFNYLQQPLPFELVIADKKSNSTGLQLADLIARPIGLHVLKPEQDNRAFAIIDDKFYRNGKGIRNGYGLKCFP